MKNIFLSLASLLLSNTAMATDAYFEGLVINKIRAVGNYIDGTTFDNTIEVWFANPPTIPAHMGCPAGHRLYIDAKYSHLVSAAYIAYSTGKKVGVNIDNTLPKRDNSCEITYFDLLP
ncbi:MAG TPA: hypothetical protein PKE57_01325 [Cellvibrionaceae bacterium]|nr:hypothetical protein [Cellvibrionaceae bacterium]HMW49313.1 hypothetical protein [Cellvibrionaceae bacterium]